MTAMLAPVLTLRSSGLRTLTQQALAILARYGGAANLYLPGVGAISGITAGNWLNSAGATAATVDGQVGLVVSAGKAVGPELVTNGDFSAGSAGWSVPAGWSIASGVCTATTTPASFRQIANSCIAGKFYLVEFDWTHAGGTLYVRVGVGAAATFTTSGRKSVVLVAAGTQGFEAYGGAVSGVLDNISVRELPGAHLTQSTAANRPVLRRGLVNQLLWSGDFTNSAWVKTNTTVVANAAADHEGVVTADKLVATDTSGVHAVQQTVTLAAGVHSYVVRAKAGEYGWLAISMDGTAFAYYNLSTGGVGTVGAGHSAFISEAGNGYYDCIATFTFTAGAKTIFHNIASANNTASFTGNGTNGVFLASAALFTGTVTAQQIIAAGGIPLTTTAPASSTNGPFSWQFDGSNDSFASTMTPGNAGFFCSVAQVNDSGVLRTLLGAGASSDAVNGVSLFRNANNAIQLFVGDGMTRNNVSAAYPVATNSLASAGWDASTMFVGVGNTETSSSKSVNCETTRVINVGNQSGIFMFGTIGATIIMPTVLPTATERATLRQFVASLSGVAL